MKSICSNVKVKMTIGVILFLLAEVVLTRIGFNDAFPWVNILLLMGLIVLIIKCVDQENNNSIWIRNILILGCIARIFLMYISIYGGGKFGIPFINTDEHIYLEALEKYLYGKELYATWYKTFVYWVMCIFGYAREMIHLLNIICFALSYWILQKMFNKYEIREKLQMFGFLLFSFFPTYLLLSSSHLREGFMIFFGIIALYAFDRIIDEKKYSYIVLMVISVGVAAIFHSGAISLLAPFVLWLIFYDKEENKFVVNKKKVYFLVALALFAVVIITSPIGRLALAYLPMSLTDALVQIQDRVNVATVRARSNYLMNIEANDMYDILFWWPLKMFYFQFSPLPDNWSSVTDVIGFLTDSLFYIIASVLFIKLSFVKKYRWNGLFFLAQMVCFQVVYAWGTTNAGGAMRHRVKIMGVVLAGVVYALEMLLREKRNKKC